MYQKCFVALAVIVVAGCNKPPSMKTCPVTGTVTYNGKPLEGATVVYVPPSPDAPRASGTTDAEGKFSLTTYVRPQELLRGAVPGDYKVTVIKQTIEMEPQAAAAMKNYADLPAEEKKKLALKMMGRESRAPGQITEKAVRKGPKDELPEKYGKPETSGLTDQVVVGETDPREFKLTD